MGCWNQTCGLTQLHIRAGQKVMVVPLTKAHRDSLCYTTPFYSPFPVPFYAEYDDYGAGENESGIGLRFAMDHIRDQLEEMELGENQYHDIAVKKDEFDKELFWQACHENRLRVKSAFMRDKTPQEVGFTMIHMGVFDYLAENYVFSDYDYSRETGRSKYYKYKLQDVLAGVPEFVDVIMKPDEKMDKIRDVLAASGDKTPEQIEEELADIRWMFKGVNRVATLMRSRTGTGSYEDQLTNEEGYNRAADWLMHYPSHMSYNSFGVHQLDEFVRQLSKENDREGMIELISEYLKLQFIDTIMLHTRKFWSPQAGAGSQQQEPEGYELLIASIQHVLAEEKAEWDEEDEDEEWEAEDDDEDDGENTEAMDEAEADAKEAAELAAQKD